MARSRFHTGYVLPPELGPKVAEWRGSMGLKKDEAEAAVFGVFCRNEGPYADRAEVEDNERQRFQHRDWKPLCRHCGRLAHEGFCAAGTGRLDVSAPAPVVDPALAEGDPRDNSPEAIGGPRGGWRAA